MQHPLTQQGEARQSIHLPFDRFKAIDLAFKLPVTVGQREPGPHGGSVVAEPCREALQSRHPTSDGAWHVA